VTPTGKAAKRASELLNNYLPPDTIASTTIHKALAPKPSADDGGIPLEMARRGRARDPFSFTKNAQDPLKVNILIVDETSMVDVRLMASLLRAVPKGTRIVFVGDHNQLPSVGPGAVLRDMLASGIPTAMLTEIVRSDGGGRVVRACHAIKDGIVPEPAATVGLPTENWVHVEREDMREIAEIIVGLHESASRNYVAGGPEDGGKGFDPVWGMQVVSPQNGKLPIACAYLNRLLAAKLNPLAAQQEGLGEAGLSLGSQAQTSGDGPPGNKEDDYEVSGPPFFVGDKVVRTKNGLCDEMLLMPPGDFSFDRPEFTWRGNSYSLAETAIVNGDMGTVLDIVEGRKGMQVIVFFRNPGRLCRLPYGGCELIQAYAMTCHKAQGSGFPYVIVPVHEQFYWDQKKGNGLFSREWVYTAVSRAEKLLVTVGQFSAIRKAVGRKTVHLRQTKLANLIRKKFPQLIPTEA
jgi:exodeoxyribonuclease V alpha subunit